MTEKLEFYIKQLEQWMWQSEAKTKTHTGKFLFHSARILFAVMRDIFKGDITLHAMSLVYTTLLSIVPFLALTFSVLKAFGVHNRLEPILLTWLAPLGSQGPVVIDNMLNAIDNMKVGILGSVGLALLIYMVISLIQKVERSFNEVWKVNKSRSLVQRFSNYMSVIMVGPVLIFSAMGATTAMVGSETFTHILDIAPIGWLYALVSRLVPYFIIIALFTFLYIFIPNTKVKARYAFTGAVVAGIMWQSAVFGFAIFVANSSHFKIYASLAVGILMLMWIYIIWLILLIGASVAFYAQHAKQITKDRKTPSSAVLDEYTGLGILYRVAQQFDRGGGGVSLVELESSFSVGPETIRRIINKLTKNKILTFSEEGECLLPAQSLDKMQLRNILRILRAAETTLPSSLTSNHAVTGLLEKIDTLFDTVAADKTVADWIREQPVNT